MHTIEQKLILLKQQSIAPKRIFDIVIHTVQSPYNEASVRNARNEHMVLSKKRYRNLVYPRQLYCYIACLATQGHTLEQLGLIIGKDHATVLYGKRTISNYLDINMADIKHDILKIAKKLEMLCFEEPDYVI